MKTSDIFYKLIQSESDKPGAFYRSARVIKTNTALYLLKRIAQLEKEFEKLGYMPGKPDGEEHKTFSEIFGFNNVNLCKCGCGETAKIGNDFINGHHNRLRIEM